MPNPLPAPTPPQSSVPAGGKSPTPPTLPPAPPAAKPAPVAPVATAQSPMPVSKPLAPAIPATPPKVAASTPGPATAPPHSLPIAPSAANLPPMRPPAASVVPPTKPGPNAGFPATSGPPQLAPRPAGLPPAPPGQPPRPALPNAAFPPMKSQSGPQNVGATSAPPVPPASAPTPAKAKRPLASIFKFLPFIIGGVVLLGVVLFFAMRFLNPVPPTDSGTPGTQTVVPGQETKLTYWGLWEPSEVVEQIFSDFEAANPGITVEYVKQVPTDYRERLQTAIAQGTGPDLFRFHASWTPMLREDLAPVPTTAFTASSFQSTFYPVATQQLQYNNQLRGIPLMYDGLALYYNEDILKTADAQPPTTWADLRILATQLTVTSNGQVERGGLAIGNATNVEHFSDILGLLMLQNGADLTNPSSPEAREALIFYTDFLKTYKVWSEDLPSSTVAFARGDVAMMFAPSWRAHEILAQNPNLKFGIAPLPKLGTSQAAWATYWAEGVNAKSKNKDAAWKLLTYLSQADVMQKMYSQQSGVRKFGEIYARKDLADKLVGEPLVTPFLSDAPQAQGWYMSSFTHDNGINDQIIKYYRDAVTAVLSGTAPDTALQTVAQGVSQVLRQYGIATSVPAAAAPSSTSPGSQLNF